jgi:hypothetical protein
VKGSCAEGHALDQLQAGLDLWTDTAPFEGLTFDLPCDEAQAGDAWWDPTAGPSGGRLVTFYVSPSGKVPMTRHEVVHELGHDRTLQAGPDGEDALSPTGEEMAALVGTSPEWYPSQESRTEQAEQLAELIAFCKQESKGGSDEALADPGWKCPASLVPFITRQ